MLNTVMRTHQVKSSRPARPTGKGNQRGFTLIEMIVGLSIMAVLVSALATDITEAFRAAYFQRTGAVSVDEARRIIPIITKDLQTAKWTSLAAGKSVILSPDNPGSDFTIYFQDPEDETPLDRPIVYTLDESNLIRSEDGVNRTIARHVKSVVFSFPEIGAVEVTLATWTEENEATETSNNWTVYQRPSP